MRIGNVKSDIYFATYCSKTKSDIKFGKPKEIYLSPRVKSFFKYAPDHNRIILSYKYGYIDENQIIDNYEATKFGILAHNHIQQLKNKIIVFWSPRPLVETPWIDFLNKHGLDVKIIKSIKNYHFRYCGTCKNWCWQKMYELCWHCAEWVCDDCEPIHKEKIGLEVYLL